MNKENPCSGMKGRKTMKKIYPTWAMGGNFNTLNTKVHSSIVSKRQLTFVSYGLLWWTQPECQLEVTSWSHGINFDQTCRMKVPRGSLA